MQEKVIRHSAELWMMRFHSYFLHSGLACHLCWVTTIRVVRYTYLDIASHLYSGVLFKIKCKHRWMTKERRRQRWMPFTRITATRDHPVEFAVSVAMSWKHVNYSKDPFEERWLPRNILIRPSEGVFNRLLLLFWYSKWCFKTPLVIWIIHPLILLLWTSTNWRYWRRTHFREVSRWMRVFFRCAV